MTWFVPVKGEQGTAGIDPGTWGGINPTDDAAPAGVANPSTADVLRSASNPDNSLGVYLGQSNSAAPQDVPAGDARTTSDVPTNSDLPRTWDQMSWLQKANAYLTDVIPNAVKDTLGMTGRAGAQTPSSTIAGALPSSSSFILSLVLIVGGLFLILLLVRKI